MSLPELVVVAALAGILILAVGTFQRNILYFAGFIDKSLTGTQDAKSVLRIMVKETRSAAPSSVGAYPIAEAGTQSFAFYSDIDNDGIQERVRYFLSASDLKKGVIKPSGSPLQYNPASEQVTTLLARNVSNGATPVFTYYDTNYDGATAPLSQPVTMSDIRLVKISIIIDADPNREPVAKTFTSQVSLRNLKDNL